MGQQSQLDVGAEEWAGEYEVSLGYILRPSFKKLKHKGLGI